MIRLNTKIQMIIQEKDQQKRTRKKS